MLDLHTNPHSQNGRRHDPIDLYPADGDRPLFVIAGFEPSVPERDSESQVEGAITESAPKASVLAMIQDVARYRPLPARHLRYLHDEAERADRRVAELRAEAEAERSRWNAEAEPSNRDLDAEQGRLRERAEAAAKPHRDDAEQLQPELDLAGREARERCGAIGRAYEPRNLTVEYLLQPHPASAGAVAARAGLPDPREDRRSLLRGWLAAVMTVLVGTGIGASLGLAAHVLQPDSLGRHPWIFAAAAIFGAAIAAFCRKAIYLVAGQAG